MISQKCFYQVNAEYLEALIERMQPNELMAVKVL
jgi:hypothetical protein